MRSDHIRIAAGILCGILAAAVLAAAGMLLTFDRLIGQTDALLRTVSECAPGETAGAALHELEQSWRGSRFWLQMLIPNENLSDLNEAIARLPAELSAGNDVLSAELAAVSADLKWLKRKQLPGISLLTGTAE